MRLSAGRRPRPLRQSAVLLLQPTIITMQPGWLLIRRFPADITADVYVTEILQVISNLLANALDALPENGVLKIRLRKSQSHIHLLIADNGHGIPEEHRDKIFKPFFTTKEDRGNGLGLALSKEIVERHRGKIRVRSSVRPDRRGTTFRISLPC